jgi:hypothetical protein
LPYQNLIQEEEEAAADPQPRNYALYKCGDCGKLITGIKKDGHVREAHCDLQVQWEKISG